MHRKPPLPFLVALALLALTSSGCATRRVLALGAGIDWIDANAPPPQSRIVPDTLVFCASGDLEVHADAFPPPDVQWRGQPTAPVRLVATMSFARVRPLSDVRMGNVTYFDVRPSTCGPTAERARIAIPPEHWQVASGASCSGHGDRQLRALALAPGETSIELPPELIRIVPARRFEVVALSELRPALATREPRPAAYALLPLALAADGAGYAVAGAFFGVCLSPYLAAMVALAPFLPLYQLGDEITGRGVPDQAPAPPEAADSCAPSNP